MGVRPPIPNVPVSALGQSRAFDSNPVEGRAVETSAVGAEPTEPGAKRDEGHPSPRGDESRGRIIRAAMELYEVNGTRRTSLSDIADRAGTTPGNLLYHFGSKDGLVLEVVRELEAQRTASVEKMAAEGGIAMLRALASYAHETEERPNLAGLALILCVENLGPDDPAYEYFIRQRESDRRLLRKGLEAGIERGELRSDFDIDRKVDEMRAFGAGAWLTWLLDPTKGSLSEMYSGYYSSLIRDLKAD